jgi:uncharacterized protein (DUF1330 family)
MSAYIIAQIKVHDRAEYYKYETAFMDASKLFGVKVLAATNDMEILEGEWPQVRNVIMEYPSLEMAKNWYQSKQYQEIVNIRFRSATTNMILVDGLSLR